MAHTTAEYPRECCGIVAQRSGVQRYIPCCNLVTDLTEHSHLSPEDYATAEDWETVIATVHNHSGVTTQTSELDEIQCDVMLLPWHIVSWLEGDLHTIQPWGKLPLLRRPFVLGRFDCWGLMMSYFRQMHGIELTDYRVNCLWWEDSYPENFYHGCWYECGFHEFSGVPQPDDMAIMQVQANK